MNKHKFEITLTLDEFESKFQSQSFMAIGDFINKFNSMFPGSIMNGASGHMEEFSNGDTFGVKLFIEIESDVTHLEVAEKQVELYSSN